MMASGNCFAKGFGFVCLLILASCGGPTDPPLADRSQAIINGTPDSDPAHDAVVFVHQQLEGDPAQDAYGTGTVIAPGVVVTSAAWLDQAEGITHSILFGAESLTAEERPVSEIWVHPELGSDGFTNNIALMHYSGGTPAGVVPLPILSADMALTQDDLGAQVSLIGFGTDGQGHAGTRRIATNYLSTICETEEGCAGSGEISVAQTICVEPGEGLGTICGGDAGSPWLMIRNGRETLVGVTSFGLMPCDNTSCAVRVDAYSDFIADFVAADKQRGDACSVDIECISGHCADGVCCDYACDGLCEACNQAGAEGSCEPVTDNALEAGCKAGGGGCAAVPRPDSSAPWVGLSFLGLLGLALIWRLRRG